MDKNVNIELYEFLYRHQCEISKVQGSLKFFVRIPFDELTEFVCIVGREYFVTPDDVVMFDDHIVFDLNYFFEYSDMKLSDYRACFENYYKEFEADIREMEG